MQEIAAADEALVVRDGQDFMDDQPTLVAVHTPAAEGNGDGFLAVAREKMLFQWFIVASANIEESLHRFILILTVMEFPLQPMADKAEVG